MKLSDFITDIGRPVAFYPGLKRVTKSTTATILLCQFIYWIGKGEAKDGSVYKTSKELEDETGLTYEEQKTARARLKDLGVLTEKYARLDHTVYFKIDTNKLDALWASSQCHDGEKGNANMANKALTDSINSNTETTTQTTTQITVAINNKTEPVYEPCDEDGLEEKPLKSPMVRDSEKFLIDTFSELTGVKYIPTKSPRDWKEFQVMWLRPLKKYQQLSGTTERTVEVMEAVIKKMRRENWQISSPHSLDKTFAAMLPELSKETYIGTTVDGHLYQRADGTQYIKRVEK